MNPASFCSATVVIPTFNRGERLRATLTALLANAAAGLEFVEILVVDDGSPSPAAPLVDSLSAAPPFALRCIRQPNRGPGAARNTGFREARGSIVIFVDDDIVAPPSLIQQHIGAHSSRPNCVIYGISSLREPALPTPLFRFISALSGDSDRVAIGAEFVPVDVPASGHISVERGMFDRATAIYRDDLTTPAAEEFALAYRLKESGIQLLLAPGIVAWHDQSLDFESICRQQYKHALGTAEVIAKYPGTRSLPALERIIRANLEPPRGFTFQTLKRTALRYLAIAPLRRVALRMVEAVQFVMPTKRVDLDLLYRAVVSAYYRAGLRDGSRRKWSS